MDKLGLVLFVELVEAGLVPADVRGSQGVFPVLSEFWPVIFDRGVVVEVVSVLLNCHQDTSKRFARAEEE